VGVETVVRCVGSAGDDGGGCEHEWPMAAVRRWFPRPALLTHRVTGDQQHARLLGLCLYLHAEPTGLLRRQRHPQESLAGSGAEHDGIVSALVGLDVLAFPSRAGHHPARLYKDRTSTPEMRLGPCRSCREVPL